MTVSLAIQWVVLSFSFFIPLKHRKWITGLFGAFAAIHVSFCQPGIKDTNITVGATQDITSSGGELKTIAALMPGTETDFSPLCLSHWTLENTILGSFAF